MATFIPKPSRVEAAGTKKKIIEEFIGRVNSGNENVSIALMTSPAGWEEPGQSPEFEEYTLVLSGTVHVRTRTGEHDVKAGEAIVVHRGEWVQYSTPREGAQYVAVCIPAFSPQTVHRDS